MSCIPCIFGDNRKIEKMIYTILKNIKAAAHDETMPCYQKLKKEFGSLFALKCVTFKWIALLTDYHLNPYNNLMKEFCRKEFLSISEQVKANTTEYEYNSDSDLIAWTLWWQGFDQAPELVKFCIESQKAYFQSKGIEHIVLDQNNYMQYAFLPDEILEKVDHGLISFTHFSDILRAELLRKHGGVWIDATVFISGELDDAFFELPFYTNKKRAYPTFQRKVASKGRWTGYFLKGSSYIPLFEIMSRAFKQYWHDHNTLVDYYLIDDVISFAYDTNDQVKELIDAVPYNNEQIFELGKLLPRTYEENKIKQLFQHTAIHKLSYKHLQKERMNLPDSTWTWLKAKTSRLFEEGKDD